VSHRQQTQYEVARLCRKLTPTLPKDKWPGYDASRIHQLSTSRGDLVSIPFSGNSRLRSAELRCRETLTEAHETRRYPPSVTRGGLWATAGPDTFPFRLRGNVRAVEALSVGGSCFAPSSLMWRSFFVGRRSQQGASRIKTAEELLFAAPQWFLTRPDSTSRCPEKLTTDIIARASEMTLPF